MGCLCTEPLTATVYLRMPYVDHARREIRLKVVYYGPGMGGKTTNLEYIHGRSHPSRRGKLIALNTEAERTLFFDLLPMELGVYLGYHVRMHLCSVPGQVAHEKTRQLVLRHVDGLVFVVDSQRERLADNLASLHSLGESLRQQGQEPDALPTVVQFNKQDLPSALPPAELARELGVPEGMPQQVACASQGTGVFETLKLVTRACLRAVADPARAPAGRSPSVMPHRLKPLVAAYSNAASLSGTAEA